MTSFDLVLRIGLDPRLLKLTLPSHEERILARVSINQALARLAPVDRDTIVLALGYAPAAPARYLGGWPPKLREVGEYLIAIYGQRGSVRSVARRVSRILTAWRRTWPR